jgi:hypothetical protein
MVLTEKALKMKNGSLLDDPLYETWNYFLWMLNDNTDIIVFNAFVGLEDMIPKAPWRQVSCIPSAGCVDRKRRAPRAVHARGCRNRRNRRARTGRDPASTWTRILDINEQKALFLLSRDPASTWTRVLDINEQKAPFVKREVLRARSNSSPL